jgi:glycosyltransferase involved in cell wall biosynthesis
VEKTNCVICDSVFTVSGIDKKILLSWGIPENKVDVIPNSVDVCKFSASLNGDKIRKRFNIIEKVVMIFHGTLSYPPNLEAAIIL